MRVFLVAVATALLIALIAVVTLERFQKGSDVANTTSGAVLNPKEHGIPARGWR